MSATCFGILLTGGASTRMGRDKAAVEVGGVSLARRSGEILAGTTGPVVEVGPGTSGLPAVTETPPGSGPLAAVVAGWQHLVEQTGEKRPAVVLACDLPDLPRALVAWLVAQPGDHSVVPVVDGRRQPLCARWSVADLERAGASFATGERSLREVFGPDADFAAEDAWEAAASPGELMDVDTPEDLVRRGFVVPEHGDDWIALSRSPLQTELAVRWATLASCGAVVTFTGTVRDHADGREGVDLLVYEAYEAPALDRIRAVVADARARWRDIARVAVLHRLGPLQVGESAVSVVVSSAHRQEAFAAGSYVIDTVKETVPIWKYERWRGGEDWGTRAQPVRAI